MKAQCHEALLEECHTLAQERCVTLSSLMNLSAIKTMSEVLPDSEEAFLKIQYVTQANYAKFGANFLKITRKYKALVEPLEKPSDTFSFDFDDVNDWREPPPSGSKKGTKRKLPVKSQKGAKRCGIVIFDIHFLLLIVKFLDQRNLIIRGRKVISETARRHPEGENLSGLCL